MEHCIKALGLTGDNSKILRAALRQNAFESWCNLKYQGSGAIHFKTYTPSNNFIYNKNSLSSFEWVSAIKLSTNYANLNGVPGVSSTSNLCRKCNKEIESIPHVTGSCSFNNSLITARHHSVKYQIIELLRGKGHICFEEVYAVDTDGTSRFSDIVAFDPNSMEAHIIDPTIRYETSNQEQDKMVQEEKKSIYEKCIPFYNEKYVPKFGPRSWTVHGLFFGGRGSYGKSVIDFFTKFKLEKAKLNELSELILSKTIHIINQHIYN